MTLLFTEALELLRAGKRVRRMSWPAVVLHLEVNRYNVLVAAGAHDNGNSYVIAFRPDWDDMTANDWGEYQCDTTAK